MPVPILLSTKWNLEGFKNTNGPPDEAWLRHRWPFFSQACAPSVVSQEDEYLQWFIGVHKRSPLWLVDMINEATKGASIVIYRCEHKDEFDQFFARRASAIPGPVITSRLDNDDAISPRYVETVRVTLTGESNTWMRFVRGFQWCKGKWYAASYPGGPFLSRIEDEEVKKTVFEDEHGKITSENGHRTLDFFGLGMWLQTVHDRNIGNRFRGTHEVPSVPNDFRVTL